jgi:hypothetical protein
MAMLAEDGSGHVLLHLDTKGLPGSNKLRWSHLVPCTHLVVLLAQHLQHTAYVGTVPGAQLTCRHATHHIHHHGSALQASPWHCPAGITMLQICCWDSVA